MDNLSLLATLDSGFTRPPPDSQEVVNFITAGGRNAVGLGNRRFRAIALHRWLLARVLCWRSSADDLYVVVGGVLRKIIEKNC